MTSMDITEVTGIIFAPGTAVSLGEQLQKDIENSLSGEKIALCKTINSLAYLLLPQRSMRASQQIIIVLIITNTNDLREVMDFHDLLFHFTLVMVLDHNNKGLVNAAGKLKPYLTTFIQKCRQDTTGLVVNFVKIRNGL